MKTQMKLSLLAFSLAGLVACSSGGSGSADSTPNTATPASQTNSGQPLSQSSGNNSPTIPNTTAPLSPNLAQQIKEQKVVGLYVSEVEGKPTKNTQFLMLGTDFGTKPIELDKFPRYQLVKENYTNKYLTGDNKAEEEGGYVRVYNQTYSAVVGMTFYHIVESGKHSTSEDTYQIFNVVGVHTTQDQLPNNQATYKGIAFDDREQGGKITYHVDFANKTGSGEITGLERYGKISLHQGSIRNLTNEDQEWAVYKDNNQGIKSAATSEKIGDVRGYELLFFGPNAEEISGFVKETPPEDKSISSLPNYKIGFGATKQ